MLGKVVLSIDRDTISRDTSFPFHAIWSVTGRNAAYQDKDASLVGQYLAKVDRSVTTIPENALCPDLQLGRMDKETCTLLDPRHRCVTYVTPWHCSDVRVALPKMTWRFPKPRTDESWRSGQPDRFLLLVSQRG